MTREVYTEVTAAACDLARKGLHGEIGDSLPNLMSAQAVAHINANPAAFRYSVHIQALILRYGKRLR